MSIFKGLFQSGTNQGSQIPWVYITESLQLEEIQIKSKDRPQFIFKHSSRCAISAMVKRGIENQIGERMPVVDFYFLDLISYREISNLIAEKWQVWHESPQVLLVKNGEVLYHDSHNSILSTNWDELFK